MGKCHACIPKSLPVLGAEEGKVFSPIIADSAVLNVRDWVSTSAYARRRRGVSLLGNLTQPPNPRYFGRVSLPVLGAEEGRPRLRVAVVGDLPSPPPSSRPAFIKSAIFG